MKRVAIVPFLALLAAPVAADARGAVPLIITGGTLIDGTGREPLPDSVIVIQSGKIVTVTAGGVGAAPVEARRIDAGGSWIIPGLIDMHVHYHEWMGQSFSGTA